LLGSQLPLYRQLRLPEALARQLCGLTAESVRQVDGSWAKTQVTGAAGTSFGRNCHSTGNCAYPKLWPDSFADQPLNLYGRARL
jgi:hypothetical protein